MKKFKDILEQHREKGRFHPVKPLNVANVANASPRPSSDSAVVKLKEDLRKWFSKTDPAGDWKRINSKGEAIGPCAREPGEPKPKCMSKEKRNSLTKKERASAVAAKRKHDPNPERKGEPINVSNFGKGKISEANFAAIAAATAIAKKKSGNYDDEGLRTKPYKNPNAPNIKTNAERKKEMKEDYLEEKNVPTSPEKWAQAKAQAKSKFDVYPSAYANGWAAKKYKAMGGSWKSVSEKVQDKYDKGEYDQEGDMAKSDLRSIIANAQKMHDMLDDADNLPEWVQSKITLAQDYIETSCDYMTSEMSEGAVPAREKVVTVKHKTSGKELVVTTQKAKELKKHDYHPVKEEVELDEAFPKSTHHVVLHSSSKKIIAKGNKEEMMKKMKEMNTKEKGSHSLGMTHGGKIGDIFGEEVKPPFDKPYTTIKKTVTDKSGAKHTPMSRARDLARKALQDVKKKQTKVVENNNLNESRRMEIVREAMKDAKKKKESVASDDKYQSDPILSSQITKT